MLSMSYIRSKDGRIINFDSLTETAKASVSLDAMEKNCDFEIVTSIEDLIQIGDIVFYWQQSDDRDHCTLMVYDSDIRTMRFNAITKLLIPIGDDYKCVAKAEPSFELIKGRRYLVQKGELELL